MPAPCLPCALLVVQCPVVDATTLFPPVGVFIVLFVCAGTPQERKAGLVYVHPADRLAVEDVEEKIGFKMKLR